MMPEMSDAKGISLSLFGFFLYLFSQGKGLRLLAMASKRRLHDCSLAV